MSNLTDLEVKNLSEDSYKTESLGRGRGAFMIRKRGKSYQAFYRYWRGKQKAMVPIGSYSPPRTKVSGLSLKEIREKATALATLRQQISPQDLKEYLEQQEADRQQQAEEKRRQAEIESSYGTLEDLCTSYLSDMEIKGLKSVKTVRNALNLYCLEAFPKLAKAKARDITPDDIVAIIRKMMEQGITTTCNRVRSYLMTAFNYGMKADHNPRQLTEHGKRFNIDFNPVMAVPKQADYERVRDRRLSDDEIYDMWINVHQGKSSWSPVYGLFVRFCLACFGNRPEQLNDVKWSDIDFRMKTLRFTDFKGKHGTPKKRIVPLTPTALDILEQVKSVSGDYSWPFSTSGKTPIRTDNVANFLRAYNDWRSKQLKEKNREVPDTWTQKDLRTTATGLLTRLRIPKEQRYLLQSREDGSVESKHYDHDDRLEEKWDAAMIYDDCLQKIISGKASDTLVDLEHYRQIKGY